MAALFPELQKELLRTELEQKMRAASKVQIEAREGTKRELNLQENAALSASINQLLLGREAWLKQMREAEILKNDRALTLEEENRLNERVRVLLDSHPNFMANFKYQSNEKVATDPSQSTGFDAGLKGILSKISGSLGDGPFGFIGQLLEKILGLIFPMILAFKEMGETLNPKNPEKTPTDLVKEGSFDEADVVLEAQEQALIDKLKTLKDKNGAEIVEIKRLSDDYENKLLELHEVDLENGIKVTFSETSDEYKRHTLSLRMSMFNEISAKAMPILNAHAETVTAEQQHQLKQQQHTRLNETVALAPPSPESEVLKARMEAMATDMKNLAEKRTAAQRQESTVITEAIGGGMNPGIINMYANTTHAAKLAREKMKLAILAQQREQQLEAQQHAERQRRAMFEPQRAPQAEVVD
jgi:hypothetical protein